MGVTVPYSSGDQGVSGGGDLCLFPNGTQSTAAKGFNPTFPSRLPITIMFTEREVDIVHRWLPVIK
jgi:hypothetical protein